MWALLAQIGQDIVKAGAEREEVDKESAALAKEFEDFHKVELGHRTGQHCVQRG